MITVDSLLENLTRRVNQATQLEYELANSESTPAEETLLFRLCGLHYPGGETSEVKD